MSDFNKLSNIRRQSSSSHGNHHWMMQRLTAIALIPLVIWFICTVIKISGNVEIGFTTMLISPYNSVLLILLLSVMLYHGALGMKVVIEDYVHKECIKTFLTILVNFTTIVTIVFSVFTIVIIHLLVLLSGLAG